MTETRHTAGQAFSTERDAFSRHGYVVIPALLDPSLTAFLWSYVHTKFASRLLSFGDGQVARTPAAYDDPAFDGLLEYLRPRFEERSGYALIPTYSSFRMYKHGDKLKRHHDRVACEFGVTLSLGQVPAEPWPFHIEGKTGAHAICLTPGDALLYRGHDLFHWREPFTGTKSVQVFLFYVDRDGPHADQKFDQRPTLMRPKDRSNKGSRKA